MSRPIVTHDPEGRCAAGPCAGCTLMGAERLVGANEIETRLGLRHGTIESMRKRRLIKAVWLPGRKKPKYLASEVHDALLRMQS